MSALLAFELESGDPEDSEDDDLSLELLLDYSVTLIGYTDQSISLKIDFESPISVSQGKKPDKMVVTFVHPDLFVSQDSGKSLNSAVVSLSIPK